MAIAAVLIARESKTLFLECVALLITIPFLGLTKAWMKSLRLVLPMVSLVFIIALFSFDLQQAAMLSIRLVTLLAVSFIFFQTVTPEEMGGGLIKMGVPYGFTFILSTAMRYVPLIGQKISNILDAQRSRGIDLRPRIKNVPNIMALLMPLLAQTMAQAGRTLTYASRMHLPKFMRIFMRMNLRRILGRILRMILPKHRSNMKFGLQTAYINPTAGLESEEMGESR